MAVERKEESKRVKTAESLPGIIIVFGSWHLGRWWIRGAGSAGVVAGAWGRLGLHLALNLTNGRHF